MQRTATASSGAVECAVAVAAAAAVGLTVVVTMNTATLIGAPCLLIGLGCSPGTVPATVPSTQPAASSTRAADTAEVEGPLLIVMPGGPPGGPVWYMTVNPDGSAMLQYRARFGDRGPTRGDSASLPKGTLDYAAIASEAVRQRGEDEVGNTAVNLRFKGEDVHRFGALKDVRYFRELIPALADKWQDRGNRFDELLRAHPIYSDRAG
jgi:hypothetical protein